MAPRAGKVKIISTFPDLFTKILTFGNFCAKFKSWDMSGLFEIFEEIISIHLDIPMCLGFSPEVPDLIQLFTVFIPISTLPNFCRDTIPLEISRPWLVWTAACTYKLGAFQRIMWL